MTSQALDSDQEIIVPHSRDNQGRPVYSTLLTRTEDQREKTLLVRQAATIPVIFIPGIMGTNLRNKKTQNKVWNPPNTSFALGDIAHALAALFVWGMRGPKRRQELLKAEDVEVDDRGSIDPGNSALSKEAAQLRGWGKVMRTAYNPIMALMESRLDRIVHRAEPQGWWKEAGQHSPADYGEELGNVEKLNQEDLSKASKYQFDVWCAGYNWLQSNRQSGLDVREFIENTVLPFYRKQGGVAPEQLARMKVILVTHSMGGLVARALTQIHGYPRVLGVVHGVQPAIGSSAIYHHMRCGYEGVAQVVLGANAGEVTAVVANSPGALELTPTAEYRGGSPWLFLCDAQGQVIKDIDGKPRAYPQYGDPYEEIYKSSVWYGLVPEQNNKYLNMSIKQNDGRKGIRTNFCKLVDAVATFHKELASSGYHIHTYAHYAADDKRHSWRDMIWQGEAALLEVPGAKPEDDENGSYNSWLRRGLPAVTEGPLSFPLTDESKGSGGDGTVPTDSGQAPSLAGIPASFRQGGKGKGRYNTAEGYEHQDSYNDERAQWATFYSVVRIAGLANWQESTS